MPNNPSDETDWTAQDGKPSPLHNPFEPGPLVDLRVPNAAVVL